MPIAKFQMPDGRIGRFEVPEGTTPEGAQQLIEQHLAVKPVAAPTRTLADQLGLTARAGIKGLAAPVAIFSDALGGLTNTVQNVVAGRPNAGLQFKPASVAIDELLDRTGLPRPETSACLLYTSPSPRD
jgi:hypothetical protein